MRYNEKKEVDKDYKKYSCIIADLDKSRLQIDFNTLSPIIKERHYFASENL